MSAVGPYIVDLMLSKGCNDALQKPFTCEQLTAKVRRWLDGPL